MRKWGGDGGGVKIGRYFVLSSDLSCWQHSSNACNAIFGCNNHLQDLGVCFSMEIVVVLQGW